MPGTAALMPYTATVVASTTAAATGNSGTIDAVWSVLPDLRLILDVTAASGTTPTLDVALQITPDLGTTWFPILRFAQQTAVAARQLEFSVRREAGQAASEAVVAATGGALAVNGVLSKNVRVLWTIGGTNPSFTFAVYVFGRQLSASPY